MQRQTPPSQLVCTQAEGYVGPVPNRQQRVPPRVRVHPCAHSLRIPGDEPSPAHLLQVAPRAQRATPARAPASSRRASAAAAVPRGAQAQATAPRRARSAAQPAPRLPWPCAACAAPARPVPCWCALPAYPSTFGCLCLQKLRLQRAVPIKAPAVPSTETTFGTGGSCNVPCAWPHASAPQAQGLCGGRPAQHARRADAIPLLQ